MYFQNISKSLVVTLFLLFCAQVKANECHSSTWDNSVFSPPKVGLERISVGELKRELHDWIEQVKSTHPKLDMAVDYEELYQLKNQMLTEINDPLTQLQAFRIFSRLNPIFADAHHGIVLPGRNQKIKRAIAKGDSLFPMPVYIDDDYRIYIKDKYNELAASDEILSINGIEAKEISNHLERHARGDTARFRRQLVSDRFAELLWQHYGSSPSYSILIKRQSGCKQVELEGRKQVFSHRTNQQDFESQFELKYFGKKKIAYIKANTFYLPQGMDELFKFTQTAFASIKQAGSESLIIDVRENGGGDDRVWIDGIMPYIATKPWQRMANFIGRVREDDEDFPGRIGEVAVFDFQGEHTVSDKLSFQGKLYVLTGRRTYSSAIMFAAAIQDNQLGVIVGQDSEARGCSTGMSAYHDMPSTGLVAFTPQHWYQRNIKQSCMSGVKADIRLIDNPFDSNEIITLLNNKILKKQ
jgi:C-terminal processing protease CtpA/Prc